MRRWMIFVALKVFEVGGVGLLYYASARLGQWWIPEYVSGWRGVWTDKWIIAPMATFLGIVFVPLVCSLLCVVVYEISKANWNNVDRIDRWWRNRDA